MEKMGFRRVGVSKAYGICLCCILLLGCILRFGGLTYDYPFITHPDEEAIVTEAIKMADQRTLLSDRYERPDNGVKKAVSLLFRIYSRLIYGNSEEGLAHATANDVDYYVLARGYVAFLGSLLILVAWLIGFQYSHSVGLLAAAYTAVFPVFVIHSHYVTSDIAVTLAMALCMLAGIRYIDRPCRRGLVPIAVFAAWGTLDKYPGILTCGMIAVVVIAAHRKNLKEILIQGLLSFGVYVLVMFLLSPNLFLDWKDVYQSVLAENRDTHLGADGLGMSGNMMYYWQVFSDSLRINPWLLAMGVFVSFAIAICCGEKKALVFSVVGFWWVLLSSRSLHWERWGIPMYFGWIMILAYGTGKAIDCLSTSKNFCLRRMKAVLFGAAVVVALAVCPLSVSIGRMADLVAAKTYVNSVELLSWYGISENNCAFDARTGLLLTSSPSVTWTNKTVLIDDVLYRTDSRMEYILQNDGQEKRYQGAAEKYTDEIAEYEWLDRHLKPITEYKPVKEYTKSDRLLLITQFRKLVSAMIGNYVTGDRIALFDALELPLYQTMEAKSFRRFADDSAEYSEYVLGILTPGEYTVLFDSDSPVTFEVYINEQCMERSDNGNFCFTLKDRVDDASLTVRYPLGSECPFETARMIQHRVVW